MEGRSTKSSTITPVAAVVTAAAAATSVTQAVFELDVPVSSITIPTTIMAMISNLKLVRTTMMTLAEAHMGTVAAAVPLVVVINAAVAPNTLMQRGNGLLVLLIVGIRNVEVVVMVAAVPAEGNECGSGTVRQMLMIWMRVVMVPLLLRRTPAAVHLPGPNRSYIIWRRVQVSTPSLFRPLLFVVSAAAAGESLRGNGGGCNASRTLRH